MKKFTFAPLGNVGFSSGICIFPLIDEKNNTIHPKEHNTTHIDITRNSQHHLSGT
jgi:hypothetical protein